MIKLFKSIFFLSIVSLFLVSCGKNAEHETYQKVYECLYDQTNIFLEKGENPHLEKSINIAVDGALIKCHEEVNETFKNAFPRTITSLPLAFNGTKKS
ncbi:MAG: hypothetical protein COB76_07100 [Alphaproteobacteria bacterium]|nr:MAG: hypothetical protein COB76_07100 [Alphaproteobacteria bacterium]